jgi:hypothetical protein
VFLNVAAGIWRRLALLIEPRLELLGTFGNDVESHACVLMAAELGALSARACLPSASGAIE